jgi:outer membrane lipoprotein SlyB
MKTKILLSAVILSLVMIFSAPSANAGTAEVNQTLGGLGGCALGGAAGVTVVRNFVKVRSGTAAVAAYTAGAAGGCMLGLGTAEYFIMDPVAAPSETDLDAETIAEGN